MIQINLTFLGTGGGRFSTIYQKRKTGGIRLDNSENKIHIDPGPGALFLSHKRGLNPTKLDTIILTHSHTDHYNDVEVLLEAMTKGGTKDRGQLITTESGIKEVDKYGPAVSNYHQGLPKKLKIMNKKEEIKLNKNTSLFPKEVQHSDPSTCGFTIDTKFGKIGYTTDTEIYPSMEKDFSGCRILIMNVTRPRNKSIPYHLSTNDAIDLLRDLDPTLAIMTHLGMNMLENEPNKEAKKIQEETNQRCIAAHDGMKIRIKEDIQVLGRQKKLTRF